MGDETKKKRKQLLWRRVWWSLWSAVKVLDWKIKICGINKNDNEADRDGDRKVICKIYKFRNKWPRIFWRVR